MNTDDARNRQPIVSIYEADPDGRPVVHHRTVDTLGIMLRAGTITHDQHDCARALHSDFRTACMSGGPAMSSLTRSARGGLREASTSQMAARQRVRHAIDTLGGPGTVAASCVWAVVGQEMSLREWAIRRAWSGAPISARHARATLVSALSVLTASRD